MRAVLLYSSRAFFIKSLRPKGDYSVHNSCIHLRKEAEISSNVLRHVCHRQKCIYVRKASLLITGPGKPCGPGAPCLISTEACVHTHTHTSAFTSWAGAGLSAVLPYPLPFARSQNERGGEAERRCRCAYHKLLTGASLFFSLRKLPAI